ncbi:TetR/AcrR family transcriptional regulator [Paeniglutamicibacter kerguelensis]|uniref:AcrR family transcriptional regulator n=1 Tax=Paeniglutamicibacter kerguelensis TaxID=254788 RepID=A0ABS4XB71_9MICC|nr:TetR/AcrR family transcriptional regulator [Paeniglutamicibacter kerguelensis]MBP2385638.1 AcrR family transcriptional regulator [Paeniglutamicibacter kerguelensis]
MSKKMLETNIRGMGKAAATKALLQERALALFVRQGFDETTVAQITEAAGVSQMTFYRHFPTKDAVVFDDPYDPVIAEIVAAQEPGLPALERVRLGLLAAWGAVPEPGDNATKEKIGLIAGHPRLAAGIWENNRRTEDLIVEALTGTGTGRFEARVAAGACLGGLTAALLDWASEPDGQELGERMCAALAVMGASDRALRGDR